MHYDEREEAEGMRSLQIRDMPEDVYEALSHRAQSEHRSLAQQAIVELRRMPEMLARDRRQRVLEQLRERIAQEGARPLPLDPAELVREDRQR
jgi:antitoxin FitA